MITPIIRNNITTDYSNIGAMVCRTPKTIHYADVDEEGNDIEVDHRCELVSTVDDLIKYFGDPFINPSSYTDLLLAYDLVSRGTLVYISSVYEMENHLDTFEISYNGYTEFTFTDEAGYDLVGYKLKSDIKFCQPILRSSYNGINRLDIFADLYLIDRNIMQKKSALVTFDQSHFYKTLHFVFDVSKETTTDKLIIDTLWENGLELHIVNEDIISNKSLIEALTVYPELNIYFKSYDKSKESPWDEINPDTSEIIHHDNSYDESRIERNMPDGRYWYNVHTDLYTYKFDKDIDIIAAYKDAIELLSEVRPAPHMLCVSKISQAVNIVVDDTLVRSYLQDADYDTYAAIQTLLLEYFKEDCDTYLFISTIDASFSKVYSLLSASEDSTTPVLPRNYNCDLYYGFASDYVDSSLFYSGPSKVFYTAALLSFYNLVSTASVYMTNPIVKLNISNECIKSFMPESSAKKLADVRCNSVVLFDIGAPSIYGDRSLSLLPNLRYSHISRNLVRIRRLVREYLETKKFILNTYYNIRTCINYIKTDILDVFIQSGVLSDYTVDYSVQHQTVTITINLLFSAVAESISLDFVI